MIMKSIFKSVKGLKDVSVTASLISLTLLAVSLFPFLEYIPTNPAIKMIAIGVLVALLNLKAAPFIDDIIKGAKAVKEADQLALNLDE